MDFDKTPLIPAIAQDDRTGEVLMVAHMNAESLRRTLESGQAWFWSRSRQELWHKGATSGSYLNVKSITEDCDGDVLLLRVTPEGPACHTGAPTCFFTPVTGGQVTVDSTPGPVVDPMAELFETIEIGRAHV